LLAIEVDNAGVRVEFGFELVGPTKLPMSGSGLGPVWTFRLTIVDRFQACLVCEAEFELGTLGRAKAPRSHAKSERDLFLSKHLLDHGAVLPAVPYATGLRMNPIDK